VARCQRFDAAAFATIKSIASAIVRLVFYEHDVFAFGKYPSLWPGRIITASLSRREADARKTCPVKSRYPTLIHHHFRLTARGVPDIRCARHPATLARIVHSYGFGAWAG